MIYYMQISNILVPYDGSEYSDRAFNYALDIARKYNSNIIGVWCVLEATKLPEEMVPEEDLKLRRQRDAITNILLTLESKSEGLGVNFKGIILKTDSVTDAILSFAESNNIDLIVAGSRGLGGFKKLLLGSVASALSQYSTCPVLIVK
jgi:nucleotide-binding universal stress UspA family protein